MGSDAQVAFAEGYEDGNVQDSVRGKLPDLHPVNEEQPTKEFVDWKRDLERGKIGRLPSIPPAGLVFLHRLAADAPSHQEVLDT